MSMPESNNLMRFIKSLCAISIAMIVFYSPCHAEQSNKTENLSGDPVSTKPVSNSTEDISPLARRMIEEEKIYGSSYVLAPHRQNYFLVVNYNSDPNTEIYKNTGQDAPKAYEAKFQLSFKVLTWKEIFGDYGDLFVAYTQRSVWQLYDSALSSPFRDTNFEPEVFVKFDTDFNFGGLRNRVITFGFNHQSNGESESLSRSWNRLYANFVFDKGNMAYSVKPWFVVGETNENPDIEDFFGYGEFRVAYVHDRHTIGAMLRNNFKSKDNKGAVELTWSHPLSGKIRAYAQYFYGYGESLLDYDARTNRIGIGIAINDYVHGE